MNSPAPIDEPRENFAIQCALVSISQHNHVTRDGPYWATCRYQLFAQDIRSICEFRETGASKLLNYSSAADLRASYPQFFWNEVRPYIEDALHYLRVAQEGKQWIASLYANVFSIEHSHEHL